LLRIAPPFQFDPATDLAEDY